MRYILLASLLTITAACGSDDGDTSGTSTGTSTGTGSGTPSGTGSGTPSGTSSGTPSGTGSGMAPGDGTCSAPIAITLPFANDMLDSTGADNNLDMSCATMDGSLPATGHPDVVYVLELDAETTVTLTGSDSSGQGIGAEILADNCDGASAFCAWQSNGVLDETTTLAAGRWLIIVERRPEGVFEIAVE